MAHYARIDENNIVQQVIVVDNREEVNGEADGAAFCNRLLGGTWKKTSYNGTIRKHYAGQGYRYDEALDAFIPPQPYPSWTLDEDVNWQPPVPMPTEEGKFYQWDEPTLTWIEVAR